MLCNLDGARPWLRAKLEISIWVLPSCRRCSTSSGQRPRASSRSDAEFEPGLFGCHLIPHDAPARACAHWCRNPTNAVARPVPSLDLGPTAGRHLCQCFADRRPAKRLPALGLGDFDIESLEILFRYPTAFEFRVIIAGLGEDLEQVCDMNFGYCWFWSPLPVQTSDVRRPTSPTTRSPSFWCRLWHRVLDRRRCAGSRFGRGPRFAVAVEVVG